MVNFDATNMIEKMAENIKLTEIDSVVNINSDMIIRSFDYMLKKSRSFNEDLTIFLVQKSNYVMHYSETNGTMNGLDNTDYIKFITPSRSSFKNSSAIEDSNAKTNYLMKLLDIKCSKYKASRPTIRKMFNTPREEILENIFNYIRNENKKLKINPINLTKKNITDYVKNNLEKYEDERSSSEHSEEWANCIYRLMRENKINISQSKFASLLIHKQRSGFNTKSEHEKAYAICFALGLSYTETIDFFSKLYRKRPFGRTKEEIIYSYCILNKKSYNDTVRLIDEYNKMYANQKPPQTSGIITTQIMYDKAAKASDEKALLKQIFKLSKQFNYINVSAREMLMKRYNEIVSILLQCGDIEKQEDGTSKNSIDSQVFNTILCYEPPEELGIVYSMQETIELRNKIKHFKRVQNLVNIPNTENFYHVINNEKLSVHNVEIIRRCIILLELIYCYYEPIVVSKNNVTQSRRKKHYELMEYKTFIWKVNSKMEKAKLLPMYVSDGYDFLISCLVSLGTKHSINPIHLLKVYLSNDYLDEDKKGKTLFDNL